jgi:hypothetical protein
MTADDLSVVTFALFTGVILSHNWWPSSALAFSVRHAMNRDNSSFFIA